jgi:hypothetical protein
MEAMLWRMRKDTIAADIDNLILLLDGVDLLDAMLEDPKAASMVDTKPMMALLAERMPPTNDA